MVWSLNLFKSGESSRTKRGMFPCATGVGLGLDIVYKVSILFILSSKLQVQNNLTVLIPNLCLPVCLTLFSQIFVFTGLYSYCCYVPNYISQERRDELFMLLRCMKWKGLKSSNIKYSIEDNPSVWMC